MKITNRIFDEDEDSNIEIPEKEIFEREISLLKNLVIKETYNTIQIIQALKRIKDKKLFLYGGYKSFNEFLDNFKLIRKRQAFYYLKLANGVEQGLLDWKIIEEKGIKLSINLIENKNQIKLNQNNVFDTKKFYKFIIKKVYEDKELLDKFKKEFNES